MCARMSCSVMSRTLSLLTAILHWQWHSAGGDVLPGRVDIARVGEQAGPQLKKPALPNLRHVDTAADERLLYLGHVLPQVQVAGRLLPSLEHDLIMRRGGRMPNVLHSLPNLHLEFEVSKAKQILPLTLIFVMMVAFNNLCLQFVQISFYQVCHVMSSHNTESALILSSGRPVYHHSLLDRIQLPLFRGQDLVPG